MTMDTFEDLVPKSRYSGIVPGEQVELVAVDIQGDNTSTVTFRYPNGKVDEKILRKVDLADVQVCSSKRWTFEAYGASFRLASEARRIQNAHLVDPFAAIDASNIDPYPHQIEAVYKRFLEQRPLRFLLADDPGAGKTIMSGMFIRELMLRGDVKKCLIVAPGSLVEQWQIEMWDKFGLDFEIFSRQAIEDSRIGNPFLEKTLLLARLDQVSRDENLVAKLQASQWDLVIVDEAHKMSAQQAGKKINKTKRYQLGEKLGGLTRHLLLLTATPHNGKNEDFYHFMKLLDAERFAGRLGTRNLPDLSDLMRRYIKENMRTFDGEKIFPEREARTMQFKLSQHENELYNSVTDYVRFGMEQADVMKQTGDKRRGLIASFALTVLQRRLASSPAAIYNSLERRHSKLMKIINDLGKHTNRKDEIQFSELEEGKKLFTEYIDDDGKYIEIDEIPEEDQHELEDFSIDAATVSQTFEELQREVRQLSELLVLAKSVRDSGQDAKWTQLREWLRGDYYTSKDKLIIFSEYRDTIEYISERIENELGNSEAVAVIHGGLKREHRRNIQDQFMNDPVLRILVATDAAGEGVNLQVANLMFNYDLPWNPNRIEQRFGRIHRIGQHRACHLFNLVAYETREGQVFDRLFKKIEEQREAYGDQVYDILGETFIYKSLREILLEAITENSKPHRNSLSREDKIDYEIGDQLKSLLEERALSSDFLDLASSAEIRRKMEEAKARKLHPWFVQSFFSEALKRYRGSMIEREKGRYEITRVPASLREQDGLDTGPVHERYERVTFDKNYISLSGKLPALMVTPGTPLMDAVIYRVLSENSEAIQDGAVLIDSDDPSTDVRLLIYLEHVITDGNEHFSDKPSPVSKRFLYVEMDQSGRCQDAGPEPYLGYSPFEDEESPIKSEILEEHVFKLPDDEVEKVAKNWAIENLADRHFSEVETLVLARVAKVREAVNERMEAEIRSLDIQAVSLEEKEREGRNRQRNSAQARQRAEDMANRREMRLAELDREESLQNNPPVIVSAAMIVPQGLIDELSGNSTQTIEIADRMKTDRRAVEAVVRAEQELGRRPEVQSHSNPGYDIISVDPETGKHYFIEVKGHLPQTDEISVSTRQIQQAKNTPDSWILAVVAVPNKPSDKPSVKYITRPFEGVTTHFAQSKISLKIKKLLTKADEPK